MWRLDCFFLVIGFLGYAFKYLDQTNIVCFTRFVPRFRADEFVRAMHTSPACRRICSYMAINSTTSPLTSSELQTCITLSVLLGVLTYSSIGYMIMLYPSCIIMSHIGPSRWLPTCEVNSEIFRMYQTCVYYANRFYGESLPVVFPPLATTSR